MSPTVRFFFLFLCMTVSGCGGDKQAAKPDPKAMLAQVTVYEVKAETLHPTQPFVGETQSYCKVQIRGRVEGILLKRHFQEGQAVSKGDKLFTLDPRPFEARLQRAQALLAEGEATYFNADKHHQRLQALVKSKAVSQKEADDAKAAALVAKANMLSAKAQVTEASLDLAYTNIESPISGITSAFLKDEGDLVMPGPGDSSLLTQVTQLDPIYVNFHVTDKELQASRDVFRKPAFDTPPLTASLILSDGTDYGQTGLVTFKDPLMRQETGTFLMRVTFPNPDHLLKPGQFVTLNLHLQPVLDAVVIPQQCLLQKDNQTLVFVVKADASVVPRPIQGKQLPNNLFWVKEGLNSGERIVLDGLLKIKPGARVNVIPSDGALKDNSSAPESHRK